MSKQLLSLAIILLCFFSLSSLHSQTQTLRLKPLVSTDDAEQNMATGAVILNSSDLELGGYDWDSKNPQIIGLRFPNATLPQGATITKAYIQFAVDQTYANTSNTANISIKAEKGNALTYSATSNNIFNRTYTTGTVSWATSAWTVVDQRLAAQQTPDLKSLISEAIQTNWVSGNALAFRFSTTTNGYATTWSFDRGSAANCPELVIEYTPAAIVSISANKASGTYTSPMSVALTGTAGSTIRYTTDGTTPTATTGTVYTGPISVSTTTTIKAIGVLNGTTSSVLTLNYTIESANGPKTVRYKLATAADDAEERLSDGVMFLNSSDLELGGSDIGQNFAQLVGIRFTGIAIPSTATITKAYIQFSAKEVSQTPLANIDIKIQNAINAASFAATAKNITSRNFTGGKTVWTTQRWSATNDRTALQQTPDLANLIKEAMATGGWNASMSFVMTLGSSTAGWANAYSFDGSAAAAPELVIEYSDKPIERTLLSNVVINEATGSSSTNNPLDFIEIYNNNTNSISLDSVFLTDDKSIPQKFIFRNRTLSSKAFAIVNADESLNVSTETTAAFGIPSSGGRVYLYQQFNGVLHLLDSLVVGETSFNNSYGRLPDASSSITKLLATPSKSNNTAKKSEKIDLFIWAGQSNAQGWSGDAAQYPVNAIDSAIRLNYVYYQASSSNGEWIKMQPQTGLFAKGHFGPEVSFSRKLKESGYNPAIFKFTKGGTSLYGDWKEPGQGGMYDAMVVEYKKAIKKLEDQGHTVVVRGFVWIQGESDAVAGAATTYQAKLTTLINDLRTKVVNNSCLPIILGVDELYPSGLINTIVQAQKAIVANDNKAIFTSMIGLPKADVTHLTPSSLVLHGNRIYDGYTTLIPNINSYFNCNANSVIASKPGGTYYEAFTVTLSGTAGTTIRYTTDGSTPTATTGTVYTAPISVSATTTIKAISVLNTTTSSVLSLNYTIAPLSINADKTSGTYYSPFSVVLSAPAGTTIRYTTDGSTPTATTGMVYTAPISVSSTTTIKAISVLNTTTSTVLTLNYTLLSLSVSSDKTAGTYYEPLSVTLTGTSGATIRYTTDGSTPTATTGTVYTAPISITSTRTIKAIAVLNGSSSAVGTWAYTIAPLSINADKTGGTYYEPFTVSLTGTAGTTIRYTTDGSTPTATTGTVYSAPIPVSSTMTIKAISVLNTTTSSVLSLNYTIAPLSITASRGSGTFYESFNLVLSGTAGTVIRYTTDGSTPTATTGTVYTTPIAIAASTNIKAISVLNSTTSSVLNLTYTFQNIVNIKTSKYKIAVSSDDAEEYLASGNVYVNSSDLELGGFEYDQSFTQVVGLRFPNIVLPANVVITKAYIQFSAKAPSQTPLANIDIKMQTAVNAPTFTAVAKNISSRASTVNKITWATQQWVAANDRTALQQTPDISSLIKGVMASNGWNANMSWVFTLGSSTAGWANAMSFDGAAAGAPELVLEYGEKPIERTKLTTVFINEATGSNTLNRSLDWVEVYNSGADVVSMDSVYLTDDKKSPTKFMFKKGNTLAPKGFIVVNADDTLSVSKDTTAAFGISTSGETVYMFQRFNGVLYQIDSLNVGATIYNTSWGRSPDASTKVIKFSNPTPSVSNNGVKELVDLTFSHQRGLYTAPFSLTITAPQGMTIKYTTNSSVPSATNGTTYSAPIAINSNSVVKIYAYSANAETKAITHTYLFLDKTATQIGLPIAETETGLKNIPIVNVSSTITSFPLAESPCTFEYINKFGESKSTSIDAGFKIFGSYSKIDPSGNKKSIRIYFKSLYGNTKLDYSIFDKNASNPNIQKPTTEFDALDLKAGHDMGGYWVPTSYMSEPATHGLMQKMNNQDVYLRPVHLFYNGSYYGVYTLRERFNHKYAASYYGGEDTEYDFLDGASDGFPNWSAVTPVQGGSTWKKITTAIAAKNFQEFKRYVDVKNIIDFMLIAINFDFESEVRAIVHNDGVKAKLKLYHNDTDAMLAPQNVVPSETTKIATAAITNGPANLFIMSGVNGNPVNKEYQTLVRDRVQDLYISSNGLLNANVLKTMFTDIKTSLKPFINLDITKWRSWNGNTYANWDATTNTNINTIADHQTRMVNFLKANNFIHTLQAVSYSKPAGSLSIGEKIFITNPNANTQVYYTLDGTDVVLDNAVSPTAKLYNAATGISLPLGKTKIRARAFTTGNFGMYADIEYLVTRPLKITAIAYQPNPAAPAAEPKGSDAFEFFNITNTGTTSIDVSNFMVTEAIDTFRFPQGISLASGETIMMCSDDTKYPVVTLRKFKWAKGKLANEGENISFRDNLGNLINEVRYDTLNPWPYAKGNGSFIRLKSNTLDNSKGGSWEAASLSTYLNANVANLQNTFRFVATAQLQGDAVQIQWVANTATKVESYSIEKMNEQGEFELKGLIQAHNSGLQSYTYSDRELIEGDNVYRVKMSQENSLPRYTDPIKVEFKSVGNYMIYPNPASGDVIMIDLKDANLKETQLELYNSLGQLMKKATVKEAPLYAFPIANMQAGVYQLVVKVKGRKTVAKSFLITQ